MTLIANGHHGVDGDLGFGDCSHNVNDVGFAVGRRAHLLHRITAHFGNRADRVLENRSEACIAGNLRGRLSGKRERVGI